jgi:hypothetical protein
MSREPVDGGMSLVALQANPELIALAVAYLVIPVLVGYWIYRDASGRGTEKAINWALAVGLLGLMGPPPLAVGIALYLSVRGEFGPSETGE